MDKLEAENGSLEPVTVISPDGIEGEYPGPLTDFAKQVFTEQGYTIKPSGKEPNQEPVAMPTIPPYQYPEASRTVDRKPVRSSTVEPYQKPPTRPVVPEKPVERVIPPVAPVQPVTVIMSHPETVTLPPAKQVETYKKPVGTVQGIEPDSEVKLPPKTKKKSEVHSSKPEERTSIQKKEPLKPEERTSNEPEERTSNGSSKKTTRKFNGSGGRIHTEAQIDQILDWYLETGELPDYVSERQRYDYRHHIRLPERRELLDKQQTTSPNTSNQAGRTHSTASHKDNITRLPRTGTHHS